MEPIGRVGNMTALPNWLAIMSSRLTLCKLRYEYNILFLRYSVYNNLCISNWPAVSCLVAW